MTRDEIIEAMDWHAPSTETGPDSLLARVERVIARAIADEREACAKIANKQGTSSGQRIAEKIRERGNK